MNFAKAQKEIVNELLKGRSVKGFDIDERHVLVSPDGFRGFIFPVSTVCFNLDRIKKIAAFSVADIVKEENELKLTPDFRLLDARRNLMCRRLKGTGKNTYVNVKYLEYFQNPRFFQEKNNLGVIVVTEGANGADIPVGIILPIRCTFDDGTYYGDTERM